MYIVVHLSLRYILPFYALGVFSPEVRPNKKKYSHKFSEAGGRFLFLIFTRFLNFLIVFFGGMAAVFTPYR